MAFVGIGSCGSLCGRWSPMGSAAHTIIRRFAAPSLPGNRLAFASKRDVSMVAAGGSEDHKLLSFGKHKGQTYSDVATSHPEYGAWVLKSVANPTPGKPTGLALADFAGYLEASAGAVQWGEGPQAKSIEESQLTQEQLLAVQRVLSGENVLITGAAGTGKSFLLRYLVQQLQDRYPNQVAVTATTGIAAANIGGQTLHSFAGIGLGFGGAQKLTKQIVKKTSAVEKWQQAKVLVVDEISMLDGGLFGKLEQIARHVRKSPLPFGGLQLVLCGDFLQLPPVVNKYDVENDVQKGFCFEAPAWKNCGLDRGIVFLQQCVRQAGDVAFADVLNEVRLGKVSPKTRELLKACHTDVKGPPPDDGIIPTKLYCLNRDVDKENSLQLDRLPGESVVLKAEDDWGYKEDPTEKSERTNLVDTLNKRVPKQLHLKVGAQVILIKNRAGCGLVNGSRGTVVAFRFNLPLVRFDNGMLVSMRQERFELHGLSGTKLTRLQVPLKLGWALTVHKAAGLTLSRAQLEIDRAFEAGQAYVALSRVTCTDALWISGKGIDPSRTRADPVALAFYQNAMREAPSKDSMPAVQPASSVAQQKNTARKTLFEMKNAMREASSEDSKPAVQRASSVARQKKKTVEKKKSP